MSSTWPPRSVPPRTTLPRRVRLLQAVGCETPAMGGTSDDGASDVPDDLRALVDRVPEGRSLVDFDGGPWGLTRVSRVDGRVDTLYAEELGGRGVVSANVYRTPSGDLLKPCEMPAADVVAFLRDWREGASDAKRSPPAGSAESDSSSS